uniref:HpcH/HpaI aldolase/citrate lyase domain-containing protein n=1 Tax=Ananas comosus var. bracteatus TaxID=296719 RepID=A0A6V7NS48_ANACO|nr:unnamed protein product [Ananas comosus var. bracteatus]
MITGLSGSHNLPSFNPDVLVRLRLTSTRRCETHLASPSSRPWLSQDSSHTSGCSVHGGDSLLLPHPEFPQNPNSQNPTPILLIPSPPIPPQNPSPHSPKPSLPLLRVSSSSCDAAPLTPTPRTLKSRLAAGETLYGLFLLSSSPTLAEIAGLAGYDYVVVDLEHGPGGVGDALPCLRALAAARTPALLRLPEPSAAWAKKALDLGPQGLMFPMVDSPRAAELAVSYCRFPPRGVRGSAHTVVRASAYGLDDAYLARCEDDLLIAVQVESAPPSPRSSPSPLSTASTSCRWALSISAPAWATSGTPATARSGRRSRTLSGECSPCATTTAAAAAPIWGFCDAARRSGAAEAEGLPHGGGGGGRGDVPRRCSGGRAEVPLRGGGDRGGGRRRRQAQGRGVLERVTRI